MKQKCGIFYLAKKRWIIGRKGRGTTTRPHSWRRPSHAGVQDGQRGQRHQSHRPLRGEQQQQQHHRRGGGGGGPVQRRVGGGAAGKAEENPRSFAAIPRAEYRQVLYRYSNVCSVHKGSLVLSGGFRSGSNQCFWFESRSVRSACFCAPRIRILPSTSKKWKQTMVSTVLWLLNDMLSLETDVNVPTVRSKQNNVEKVIFCWRLESHCQKERIRIRNSMFWSMDLDPYQNVTHPEHWF